MGILLSSGKRDFILDPVCTNVTGMLGFSNESLPTIDLSRLGAFVTNPISLKPRLPARPPRILTFQGGFLLHTGHPNPGLSPVLRHHHRQWQELSCPIIVHLLGQNPYDISRMVERLEDVKSVAAIEIGVEASDPDTVSQLTIAAVESELPVIVQVPMDCREELVLTIADAGANALGLGPPRGSLPGPEGGLINGRLFGTALFPYALHVVSRLSPLLEIPLIASGGLYDTSQVKAMLVAGAGAVQFDSVLWTHPESVLEDTDFFQPDEEEAGNLSQVD
jgi:dihydroorotate dehydrogenase (NAD+) catalytic subunit